MLIFFTKTICYLFLLQIAYTANIRKKDPLIHSRFSSGFPSSPIESTTFFKAHYDWSGVGWNTNNHLQSITMISDIHFIAATHYSPKANSSVSFLGSSGKLFKYDVVKTKVLTTHYTHQEKSCSSDSDIIIGTLNKPIDPTITSYAILTCKVLKNLAGTKLLHYGQHGEVGTGKISAVMLADINSRITAIYNFIYIIDNDAKNTTDNDLTLTRNDSSSPSFYEKNGNLVLSGIHSAIGRTPVNGTYLNFDALPAFYVEEISSILTADGRALSLQLVNR